VSLHVAGVAPRHARNYTLLAVNALGSDRAAVTLAVSVLPVGESSSSQHNDVQLQASRPEFETPASPPSPSPNAVGEYCNT